ncbi:hypothetical protein ACQPU1_17740 [Clostridium paraputrificum]|uniref:hypothetical protein n=1 Tax=Clostridium paraputrificum TaxID=29363 RepID=UPI003D3377D3
MGEKIDIPVDDLSEIFDDIKVAKNFITEATQDYLNILSIFSDTSHYQGGANDFLAVANANLMQDLDKLSQYYQTCYIYILQVMTDFVNVDEEITRKVIIEFEELGII